MLAKFMIQVIVEALKGRVLPRLLQHDFELIQVSKLHLEQLRKLKHRELVLVLAG